MKQWYVVYDLFFPYMNVFINTYNIYTSATGNDR